MVAQEVLEDLILHYKSVPNSREFIMLCYAAFPEYTKNKFKGLINRTLNNQNDNIEITPEFMVTCANKMNGCAKKSLHVNYINYIEYKRFRSEYYCLAHFINKCSE